MDNGIGIDSKHFKNLFKVLSSGDAMTMTAKGSALGYICAL